MAQPVKAKIVLEDGTSFYGKSFGHEKTTSGEVVFNTAMTGYPESLTDPSYRGQILTLTYPLVGNYGVPGTEKENELHKFYESYALHISGLIITDYSFEYNHWNAAFSLSAWLKKYEIPGIYDIDTRALTKILREKGSMLGKIIINDNDDCDFYDPNKENLVAQVSTKEKEIHGEDGDVTIVLVDVGVKYNIIRNLVKRGAKVIRVPWDYDFTNDKYDGLFITNGPGDPKKCHATIEHLAKAMKMDKPIFGICLGNQLLGLAAGGDSYKLKYGHRSHNQPALRVNTQKAYITSQNHGYVIDNNSLPDEWEPLFINLNDQTNEGVKHKTKPFFSTQFHPEHSGGPTDTEFLFDDFLESVRKHKQQTS